MYCLNQIRDFWQRLLRNDHSDVSASSSSQKFADETNESIEGKQRDSGLFYDVIDWSGVCPPSTSVLERFAAFSL